MSDLEKKLQDSLDWIHIRQMVEHAVQGIPPENPTGARLRVLLSRWRPGHAPATNLERAVLERAREFVEDWEPESVERLTAAVQAWRRSDG